MKTMPLVAFAALAMAIAGCSLLPPPAPDGASSARIRDPHVQLQTQGLLSASLTSATFTEIRGQWFTPDDLMFKLAYCYPANETSIPDGLQGDIYLKYDEAEKAYRFAQRGDGETHRLYQPDSAREEDFAKLTATLQKAEGPELPASLQLAANGEYWIAHPDFEAYTLTLSLPEDEEALRLLHVRGTPPERFYAFVTRGTYAGTPGVMGRLRAEIAIKDAKGTPLMGLTQENVSFGLSRKQGGKKFLIPSKEFTLTLRELEGGNYELIAEVPEQANPLPEAYVIDLEIRNAPVIVDVED